MGGNNKKRKSDRNDKKIKNAIQTPEPTDTQTSEGSLNTEHGQKNEDYMTNERTYENESNIGKRHKKKKKHSHTTNKSTTEKDESVEERPKKRKNITDNHFSKKALDEHEPVIEEQSKDVDIGQKTYDHDESDSDEKPKKKKKKKHPLTEETTDKKGKKSNRQMKRERFLQRQAEAELASKNQLKLECLSYLSQWKHNKQNWKFMKAKQVWLFKNKFSSKFVPDESWPILLEYFQTGQGNIHKNLQEDANKVIKQMDEWTESQENEDENGTENTEITKPDDTTYKRARDLIQCLQ